MRIQRWVLCVHGALPNEEKLIEMKVHRWVQVCFSEWDWAVGCRHEDGTVRFWDASGSSLTLLYRVATSPIFGIPDHAGETSGGDEEEWPPFRKVRLLDACFCSLLVHMICLTVLNCILLDYMSFRFELFLCAFWGWLWSVSVLQWSRFYWILW